MANYRSQVFFNSKSGLPEDDITNTWYFTAADDAAAGLFAQEITEFYNQPNGSATESITDFYSYTLLSVGAVHDIKTYDLADPEPRTPVNEQAFAITAPSAANTLPREVALTMSFQAEPLSGANQARRRGRVFLGPFNTDAIASPPVVTDARPHEDLIEAIRESADMLLASTNGVWSVHSTFSAVLLPVDNGWIDDAFDTQRRRGAAVTLRTTFNG